ncbi:hypothetical protein yc1106_02209 [Curvularia clavata]|uniref:Uncharacterized protein n=1 Tax=Curvularia clavata TaxID=95742 RepID=A0A9Q9DQB2_CURCL|nr:hypothetical protein yc1106_02209 [Curvularia clavata]
MNRANPFPTNEPATVYPQTATMLDSEFTPPDPLPAGNPGTAEQNASVRRMLSDNMSRELIHSIIQTHKKSEEAGNHHIYDNLSKLAKEQLDQVISANVPQTAPMLACGPIPHDPQLGENPGTAEQNANVCSMLLANMSRELIHSIIQTHKKSEEVGDHDELDHLSKLTKEQLDQVISANELPPSQPLVEAHLDPKRKMSQGPDEEPAPCPQDAKRPRKAPTGKGPVQEKLAKDTSRVKRYGCPGNTKTCQAYMNRQWTSQLSFVHHFEDNHSEEFKSVDHLSNGTNFFICCDCESNQSLPTGTEVWKWRHLRQLAKHIYNNHLSPTKSTHHHTNAMEANGQPEQPADTPHTNPSSTELKHQLQITANPGMDGVKPGEPSGTRYEHTSHAETDNFSHSDTGTGPFIQDFLYSNDYLGGPASGFNLANGPVTDLWHRL